MLHLLANDASMVIYKKIVNVLKKMLTTSEHVKLLGNTRFELAVQPNVIPEQDIGFIRHVIDYLYSSKNKYTAFTAE